MPSRVLETVLTGKNLLSPELTKAARDIEEFSRRVEGSNTRSADSATQAADAQSRAADRVVEANRKTSDSSTDATRQIAGLRSELAALGEQKIGVDVQTADARAQLDEMRMRLAEIAASDATAQVHADVAAASAQIQQIQAELDRVARTRSEPKVTLSADEAAQQIAAVRAALVELGGQRIRPGVDTTDARMQLDELRAQLAEVDASNPDARVSAQTDAAQAQLQAVQAQLNRIDGQTVTAHVKIDSSGGVPSLTSLAMMAAPAAIPLGAAGLAGGLAGGAAATAALPGLGALALGYSGVSDAVKLLNNQQLQNTLDTQKAGAQSAKTAAAQASAAHQVSSAEAALANARANASDADVRAQEQVQTARTAEARAETDAARNVQQALRQQQTAEQSLTDAQRNARQAQDDLTAARKTAQQQIEDTANSVADNAIAQRQAVEDVKDAQKALDQARASGDATQITRAQIAFDQQIQRQKELVLQGTRLADQQADNTRKGVEGSDQVVAAQQRVADSNRKVDAAQQGVRDAADAVTRAQQDGAAKVADAQRAVADAVRAQATQQRQSAFSVQQAQASVAGAMAAVGAAAAAAGDTGSDSMARIQAQLDQVNPSTREFAGYVQNTLKPALQGLQGSAADQLLPSTEQALDILMTKLPETNRFVGSLAGEMGDLEVRAARALTGPFWQQFFTDVEHRAIPLIDDMAVSAGNVARGGAGIIQAFLPMGTDVANGIERASVRFGDWGAQLKNSHEFQDFTGYVRENWPRIEEIVGNVASMVGKLIEAGAPIGGAMLVGFQALSGVLSDLPVPVVEALLVAFLGFKSVQGVLGTIDSITGSFGKMKSQVDGLPEKLGGITGFLGGPWGLALTGATVGLSALVSWLSKSDQASQAAKDAQHGLADALRESKGALDDNVRSAAAKAAEDAGLLKMAQTLGISLPDVTDAVLGNAGALDRVTGAANGYIDASMAYEHAGDPQWTKNAEGAQQLINGLNVLAPTTAENAAQQDRLAAATGGAGDAAAGSAPHIDDYKQQLQDASDAADKAKASTNLFKTSLDLLTGANVSTIQAEAAFYDAVAQAKGATEGLSGSVLDNTGHLDLQSEAGRKAADVLTGIGDQANSLIGTMIAQGATTDEVTQKDAQLRDSFIKSAEQMGISKQGAEDLANQILGIPDKRETTITADTNQAAQAAAALQQQINDLQGRRLTISLDTKEVSPGVFQQVYETANGGRRLGVAYGLATGGPVSGPGGPTDDRAGLYALSNGEHVWTAAEVHAAGGHSAVEQLRSEVLAAGRGRADGGPIGVDLALDSGAAVQGMAALAAKYVSGILDGAGGSGGAQYFAGGGGGAMRDLGRQIAASMGFGGQFAAIDSVFTRESGWNPTAQNPTSTAYGIPQFLNSTWGAYGGKTSDPARQIRDGIQYMADRYGSPNGANAFWNAHHWYDEGGLANRAGYLAKATVEPERVLSPQQTRAFEQWMTSPAAMPGYSAAATGSGGGSAGNVTISMEGASITGRLELGTDGLVTLVDGRINGRFEDAYRQKVRK